MRKACTVTVLVLLCTLLSAPKSLAQSACISGDFRETELVGTGADYLRASQLSDTSNPTLRLARRLSNNIAAPCMTSLWNSAMGHIRQVKNGITVLPFTLAATSNSAYPTDRNNGSMWSGRGLSSMAQGGIVFRAGPISAGLIPEVTYQENKDYVLIPGLGGSRFSSGMYVLIDLPQRFGPASYKTANLGQTYIRVDSRFLAAGISNENMWWGPGISNSMMLTNTAPGFPHFFLQTPRALNIGIGRLSAEAFWGKTTESNYLDTISTNNHDLLTAGILTFQPRGSTGLVFGFARTFSFPYDSLSFQNLTRFGQPFLAKDKVTPDNRSGNGIDDERVSLLFRYVLPASQFELYGEWAREDASYDFADFIGEPEHSSAHQIGIQKVFNRNGVSMFRFYAEMTNLQNLRQNRPGLRPTPSFYLHNPHGFTNRGQMLGASTGPGSESQLWGLDMFRQWGLAGLFLERVRRDEFSPRAIYFWSTGWPLLHDVEITGGLKVTRQIRSLRIDGQFSNAKRRNRNFVRDENNKQFQVRFTWVPEAFRVGRSKAAVSAQASGAQAPQQP